MNSATAMKQNVVPAAAPVDLKLEVIIIPVADVDRAKRFYESLGWRVDADISGGPSWRAVQLTPPGSECAIIFGKGITSAQPGSVQGTFLVVDDVTAARAELLERGVDVSEVFHFASGFNVTDAANRVAGADPDGKAYFSWASFRDPDGNGWLLQEVRQRLPGRGLKRDVATLTELLREAEEGHGKYEPTAPKHHWSTWYAVYVDARQRGMAVDAAAKQAGARVEQR